MYDTVILAAGRLEADLKSLCNVESKAYLPINGNMMVQYVINVLRDVPGLTKIIMTVPSDKVPGGLDSSVDSICLGGRTMIDSLKNALELCSTDYVLVIPCDVPLLTCEAVTDFLSLCKKRTADFYYNYVSKENSEKLYPALRHTYMKLKDGIFCGGSLVLIKRSEFAKGEKLFRSLTNSRKNILALVKILGITTIFKFLTHQLSVSDIEKRASHILSCNVAGIESSFAQTAFNVDDESVFKRAKELLT